MARIPFADVDEASTEIQAEYRRLSASGAKVGNIFRVLAHSSAACLPYLDLAFALLRRATLDRKLRELAILRIAHLTGSQYERQQHDPIALRCGVSKEQQAAITHWEDSPAFDDRERAVLRFVDEATQKVVVDDLTFAAVRKYLDDTELVELTLSVGFWGMTARLLVPLEVDLEAEDTSGINGLLQR